MSSNHWLCIGIGVLVGWLVLPSLLSMFQGSKQ